MQKYDIGFVTKNKQGRYIASCGCGTIKLFNDEEWEKFYYYKRDIKCEKCGNENFADLLHQKRVVYPYVEVINKDTKGFKAKRTNLSVFYDEDYNVLVKQNMVQILIYDLVEKKIKLYKNGKKINFI